MGQPDRIVRAGAMPLAVTGTIDKLDLGAAYAAGML